METDVAHCESDADSTASGTDRYRSRGGIATEKSLDYLTETSKLAREKTLSPRRLECTK
jgi:hypothetical protein